jgi:WD40 repeat protein
VDGGDPRARDIVSIAIDPTMASLVSVDGAMVEQLFTATVTYRDGTMAAAIGPRFSIDSLTVGSIDEASGRFVANGVIGGTATVTATVNNGMGDVSASATVTVSLERTIFGPGAPTDAPTRFPDPLAMDEARAASIVYPLDHAIMPQNVYPADIQWLNGANGDLFRVKLTKPHVTVTAFLAHDGSLQNHWLVDQAAWRSIAQTDPEDDAVVVVDRFEAATSTAITTAPVHVRFARAALTGSVYYWDIAAGRIIRIDDGTAVATSFMPNPPVALDGNRCVGCHTVSHSGRYMAGRLGGGENIGAVFDLTTDLSGDPPPTVFPIGGASIHWWFSSWSPDDTRLVVTQDEGASRTMAIYDPFAGTQVAISGALPTNVTHPAWSNDGTQIAYVSNIDVWGGANTRGDISVIDVTGPDAVGGTRTLHSGASLAGDTPGGQADAYPSWSPDSRIIAFAHGTGSRSENAQAALYVMQRDGSGVVRLANASPGINNFQPRFSPFTEGGYFWLSFLSRRDYGNAEVGTRGRDFQQIWVTAIRTDAAAGEDPSSIPYWLPGQSVGSRNISAYWAPRPCRPDGETCSVGSECCGGDCRPDSTGALVCAPPPDDRCRERYETCSTDGDCCEGLSCIANVCIEPPV